MCGFRVGGNHDNLHHLQQWKLANYIPKSIHINIWCHHIYSLSQTVVVDEIYAIANIYLKVIYQWLKFSQYKQCSYDLYTAESLTDFNAW